MSFNSESAGIKETSVTEPLVDPFSAANVAVTRWYWLYVIGVPTPTYLIFLPCERS